MSLPYAFLNGKKVFATEHENLEGIPVKCPFCGAKMHVQKFPNVAKWHFVLYPGGSHEDEECQKYQGKRNLPVLRYSCCDELIFALVPRERGEKGGTETGEKETGEEETGEKEPGEKERGENEMNSGKFPKIHSLEGLLKAGVIREGPFQPVYSGSSLINLDFFVPSKWAHFVWQNGLVNIHGRVIEAQTFFSLNVITETKDKIKKRAIASKRLWFSVSGRFGAKKFVRFCLNCDKTVFADVTEKLFTSTVMDNGTYADFVTRSKLVGEREYQLKRVLIAAIWVMMDEKECHKDCPLRSDSLCKGCMGAYQGNCLSKNHVFLIDKNYSGVNYDY